MKREDVRARVRTLIIVTIELERLQDDACNEPHTLLHFAQEQRALIAELKLDASEPNNAKQSIRKSVSDYLSERKSCMTTRPKTEDQLTHSRRVTSELNGAADRAADEQVARGSQMAPRPATQVTESRRVLKEMNKKADRAANG